MANAVRGVTIEQGLDPRDFTLVAYGGGGPLHACGRARTADNTVLIPQAPGPLLGPRHADGRPAPRLRPDPARAPAQPRHGRAGAEFRKLEDEGRRAIAASGGATHPGRFRAFRRHALRGPGALRGREDAGSYRRRRRRAPRSSELFDDAHEQRYSHSATEEPCDVVSSARLRHRPHRPNPPCRGSSGPRHRAGRAVAAAPPGHLRRGQRPARRPRSTPRRSCWPATSSPGPAIIEETASSPLLGAGRRARVDDYGQSSCTIVGELSMTLSEEQNQHRGHRRRVYGGSLPQRSRRDHRRDEGQSCSAPPTTRSSTRRKTSPLASSTPRGTLSRSASACRCSSAACPTPIKAKIAHWGLDDMQPGDILLTNDSYVMGSHLNHMIFTRPRSSARAKSSPSRPRWRTGRTSAASAAASHATSTRRGLQLPFVKIFSEGGRTEELDRDHRANCASRSALWATSAPRSRRSGPANGGSTTCSQRYGTDAFWRASSTSSSKASASPAQAVRRSRTASTRPSRSWTTTASPRQAHPDQGQVTVEGDEMTVDFTDVSPQVAGYFNSGATAGRSAAQVAFKCLTTPLLLPINDGSLRPAEDHPAARAA